MWERCSVVKIIHKTPYARIEYFRTGKGLTANIAVFRVLRKRMIFNVLCANSIVGEFSLDVKCGILVCNLRHIGVQYMAYCPAICVKSGTNMPQIASKETVCEAAMGCFRLPKVCFSVVSRCRMPKKVDGVLSR